MSEAITFDAILNAIRKANDLGCDVGLLKENGLDSESRQTQELLEESRKFIEKVRQK